MATYESFVNNWKERLTTVQKSGADVSRLAPIVQRDWQTLQRGGEPLDHATANSIIGTVIGGSPVLKKPTNPLGNNVDILGNAVKDVADLVTTLPQIPRAIYREGGLIRQMVEGKLQLPDQGNPLRNLAATPGIRLIPGLYASSNLTSPEGRQQVQQHPLYNFLDVLPVAGAAGKVGAAAAENAGLVNRATVVNKLAQQQVARETGRAALLPASTKLTKTEAIYAAAAMGKPVGAVIAATGVKPLLDSTLNPISTWLHTNTKLARAHSVETRAATREIEQFTRQWNPILESMSKDERILFGKEWGQPDLFPATDPTHIAFLQAGRTLQRQFGEQAAGTGNLIGINVAGKEFFYAKNSPVVTALDDFIGNQEKYTTKAPELTSKIDDLNTQLADLSLPVTERLKLSQKRNDLIKSQDALKKSWLDSRIDFHRSVRDHAPAEFYPMIKARVAEEAVNRITGQYNLGQLSRPEFDAAMTKFSLGDYVEVFGKKEWEKLSTSIESGWGELLNAGFEPIFLHNAPTWRGPALTQGRILSTSEYSPSQFRTKPEVSQMTPEYADVAVGLTSGAAEYVNMRGTERFLTDHVLPLGLKYDEARQAVMPQIERYARIKGIPLDQAKDLVFNKEYAKVTDPSDFGFSSVRAHSDMGGETLYFPTATFKAAKALIEPRTPKTAFGRVAVKTNSLFKASLFTLSPRHFADELFGNTLLLALTSGKEILEPSTWMRAWQMAKDPSQMPVQLSHGVDLLTADQLFNYSIGRTAGRILRTVKADSVQRATEFVNKVQKSAAYIAESKKLAKEGVAPQLAEDLAIAHANSALVDFDSMLPIERTLIRQVFPFYSWTRFITTFLAKYPTDHPFRAAFINRLAEQVRADETSGLPRYFRQLFTFGEPDEEGNVRAVDVRVLNPLRDSYNTLSWAGFFSSLSPLIDVPLRAAGVDTLAGTPELFPELVYNSESGRLEAKRTTLGSKGGAMEMLGRFIPPTQSIDHFITVTDRLRRLKATDPVAYRRQLFSSLGIPFVPYMESIPRAQAREQAALSNAAKAAVGVATRPKGSTRNLRRYAVVPWQGKVVSGEGLAELIDRLHSVSSETGIPTRMLMDQVAKVVK